jgi:hypothetical protein
MKGTRWAIRPDTKATSREPIELRHNNGALRGLGFGQGGGQLRPAIQGVGALPSFGLHVFADDGQALSRREVLDRRPLGFYAKA